MILHVYHCNRLVARDKRQAVGRNRPGSIVRHPPRPGGADLSFVPRPEALGDPALSALLEEFEEVELLAEDSPVKPDWNHLEDRLAMPREEIEEVIRMAAKRGLFRSLAPIVDHERWMALSSEKGCLLVMSCVEASDLEREHGDLVDAFCDAVRSIRDGIVGDGDDLQKVFVMPNVHLAPRLELATDSVATVEILERATSALGELGFEAALGSFGYSKMLELTINAHPLGYVLRVV
jgi:hypothetical protein